MTEKLCKTCNQRPILAKEMCSGCYGRQWREARRVERAVEVQPKQLTSGTTDAELVPIEGEVVLPDTHLTALNPAEMQAAQGNLRAWLEQKLTILERDIVEANAALNEARRNGWSTSALTSARNRAVDDETYYNKILLAVEAGHTIIPDFPISIFAVRRGEPDKPNRNTFEGIANGRNTYLGHPVSTDCAPAGIGEYRNPQPETNEYTRENRAPNAEERGQPRYYTEVRRTGRPVGPIFFPSMTARSPIMRATAKAMEEKTFDQIGVCHPTVAEASMRRVDTQTARAGDPLVIGQVLHKRVGSRQKVVSFIIAWHLNMEDL